MTRESNPEDPLKDTAPEVRAFIEAVTAFQATASRARGKAIKPEASGKGRPARSAVKAAGDEALAVLQRLALEMLYVQAKRFGLQLTRTEILERWAEAKGVQFKTLQDRMTPKRRTRKRSKAKPA